VSTSGASALRAEKITLPDDMSEVSLGTGIIALRVAVGGVSIGGSGSCFLYVAASDGLVQIDAADAELFACGSVRQYTSTLTVLRRGEP
jgi:hypothetical protein